MQELSPEISQFIRDRAQANPSARAEEKVSAPPPGERDKETVEEARMRRALAMKELRERRRKDDERLERLQTVLTKESTTRGWSDHVVLRTVAGRPSGLSFDRRWFAGASSREVAEQILALCEEAGERHQSNVDAQRRDR